MRTRNTALLLMAMVVIGTLFAPTPVWAMPEQTHEEMSEAQLEQQLEQLEAEAENSEEDEAIFTQETDAFEMEEYTPVAAPAGAVFFDSFDVDHAAQWSPSVDAKYEGVVETGVVSTIPGFTGNNVLRLPTAGKHYGLFGKFKAPFDLAASTEDAFVVQYEVQLEQGLNCGGAYLKLLRAQQYYDYREFSGETPYAVMFGPDACGATNRVHFIFTHQNPITGVWTEHHLEHPPAAVLDSVAHLYTLVVRKDNTFAVKIDNKVVREGDLMHEFSPPVVPAETIRDPNDSRPDDWVTSATMPDPAAVKPADWDEDAPEYIPDPDATMPPGWDEDGDAFIVSPGAQIPDDWDAEEDGDWIAPMVPNPVCEKIGCGKWVPPVMRNPAYRGPWIAPTVENPDYKGPWVPRQIPNPAYFAPADANPWKLAPMAGVAIEVWTMTPGITFDNVLVHTSEAAADAVARTAFLPKLAAQNAHVEWQRSKDDPGFSFGFDASPFIEIALQTLLHNPILAIGVIVLVVAVPLILLCLCCCRGSHRDAYGEEHHEEEEDEEEEYSDSDDADEGQVIATTARAPPSSASTVARRATSSN